MKHRAIIQIKLRLGYFDQRTWERCLDAIRNAAKNYASGVKVAGEHPKLGKTKLVGKPFYPEINFHINNQKKAKP